MIGILVFCKGVEVYLKVMNFGLRPYRLPVLASIFSL